jgi:hypothetical protein
MTTFLAGDKFGKRLTAKDANRMLRAAQEQEAGLANVTIRDVQRVWENGHILVRNDAESVPVFSVLGYANSPQVIDPQRGNVGQQLIYFIGQRFHAHKHFFRHCVIQSAARTGEVVPAAVSGITFARCAAAEWIGNQEFMTMSSLLIQHMATQDGGDNATFGGYFKEYTYSTSFDFGQAKLIKAPIVNGGDNSGSYRSRALVLLRQYTPVWRGTLSTIGTAGVYTGKIDAYSGITDTIDIYDPLKVVPSGMTSAEVGSCVVGLQFCQPRSTEADPSVLNKIRGCIVTLDNFSMVRFVSVTP